MKSGASYRLITDEVGSVRLVVDAATGAVAQRLDYDAFGNVTLDSQPGFQPFGFAGGLYDRDTGLVRLGARDYDPRTGRFTTPDPLGFAGGSTNRYTYAGNDPVNGTDPLGLDDVDWASFAAGAAAGVLSGAVGTLDLVTGGAASQVGGTLWDGLSRVLRNLFDLHYEGPLDLVIDLLGLEAVVNLDSTEFFVGEMCGLVGSSVPGGGGGTGRALAQGATRALPSAAGQAIARVPKREFKVLTHKAVEIAEARAIDRAADALERAAAQQATRAAEESGLLLVKTAQRGGGVQRNKPLSGVTHRLFEDE